MKRLMEEYDNYALSISVTTRDPRPGEEDGVSYFFRTSKHDACCIDRKSTRLNSSH